MSSPHPSKSGPLPRRADAEALLRRGKLGRFRLLGRLGEGAMGSVLLAEDVTLRRKCALKLLPCDKDTPGQRVFLEQFIREARSAAALVHHAIVQIFQVGVAQGHAYIAMERLDGPNLKEHVEADGPMPVAQACSLIAEAAEGLGYAHEQGILHRDIKPANLVITRRGHCKVCDFGMAQVSDPEDKFHLPYNVVGTPYYLSPEAARGRSSPNVDLWALAGSLWFCLTGQPPFPIKTPADARRVHVELPLPDIRQARSDVPSGLAQLLERALALEVNRRYHRGEELAEALRPFSIEGDGIPVATPIVRTPEPVAPPTPPAGRRRRSKHTVPLVIGGLVASVLLLLIGGVAAAMLFGRSPGPEAGPRDAESRPMPAAQTPTPAAPLVKERPTAPPPLDIAAEVNPTVETTLDADDTPDLQAPPEPPPEAESNLSPSPPPELEPKPKPEPKSEPKPEPTEDMRPMDRETPTPPHDLDITRPAAVAGAVADRLGQVCRVRGRVERAGDYRGQWHLILTSASSVRVVIDADAAEAVEAKLGRPLDSLESLPITATGTLGTLHGQTDRPLIRVGRPRGIALLDPP